MLDETIRLKAFTDLFSITFFPSLVCGLIPKDRFYQYINKLLTEYEPQNVRKVSLSRILESKQTGL